MAAMDESELLDYEEEEQETETSAEVAANGLDASECVDKKAIKGSS
jgi:hypothetical protein